MKTAVGTLRGFEEKLEESLPGCLATLLAEKDALFAEMVILDVGAIARMNAVTTDY